MNAREFLEQYKDAVRMVDNLQDEYDEQQKQIDKKEKETPLGLGRRQKAFKRLLRFPLLLFDHNIKSLLTLEEKSFMTRQTALSPLSVYACFPGRIGGFFESGGRGAGVQVFSPYRRRSTPSGHPSTGTLSTLPPANPSS